MSPRLLHALAAALLAGAASLPAVPSEPAPQYSLKRSASAGSLIPRDAATSDRLPINQSYAQLSEADKAFVRGWYESMKPGDEPPYPAAGLKPIVEGLVKAQQRLLVEGELFLVATVDSQGHVAAVKAYKTPDPEMTKLVATILVETPFKPAVCDGQPCRMDFPMRQVFKRRM